MFMAELGRHLEYLNTFMKKDKNARAKGELLRTSSYYRRLGYALIRRELFESIKQFGATGDYIFKDLIKTWKDLKEWGLDGKIREGIMHECLYWVATLRFQALSLSPILVAPIHEAIPPQAAASVPEEEKLHFRGDFIILWSEEGVGRMAVVDVKADFGIALEDKYLRETAGQYAQMGIPFYFASPSRTITDFEQMARRKYLLDVSRDWEHRPFPFGYTTGPYPPPEKAPWL